MNYRRPFCNRLQQRLAEPPQRIQILAGPRQVGKTTLVRQTLSDRPAPSWRYVAADDLPGNRVGDWDVVDTDSSSALLDPNRRPDALWLVEQWRLATRDAQNWQHRYPELAQTQPFVLVIDEIQKVAQWSETIKGLWDRRTAEQQPIHLVLLGSSPLLMQRGLSESLAGRYEVMQLSHWSFDEMNRAFDFDLEQFLYFGGFPGSAGYIREESRWRDYLVHGLVQPNIEKDILVMTRVEKPALLRQLFGLGCAYSGQILSLDKALGHLNDAGNVTTLARYLELLAQAGLMTGLQKYSDHDLRRRKSPPKFQVLNNALMSAMGTHRFDEARADRTHWGRLVESAVGAHLCNTADADTRLYYWRDGALEVDFVIEHRGRLAAIEVKSGRAGTVHPGLDEFVRNHPGCRSWLVGSDMLPVGEFLRYPAAHWVD